MLVKEGERVKVTQSISMLNIAGHRVYISF